MLAPGGEIDGPSPFADLCLESLKLYPDFIAALESQTGTGIDYQENGAVELALNPEEWRDLSARAETQRSLHIPSAVLDARDLAQCAPLMRKPVAGALYYPEDAQVDPRDVMKALRAACLARGVTIIEAWPVGSIGARGGAVEVAGPRGALAADAAVLAAGAWSGNVAVSVNEAAQSLQAAVPIRGHLVAYSLPGGEFRSMVRHRNTYLLQRATGFLVAGTSTEHAGFDRSLDAGIIADIRRRAEDLCPLLRAYGPPIPWTGFRPGLETPETDGPCVRRIPDSNVWLAYGHYRNGILLAPATARRIADEIAGA
jgi:glycine oxidase